MFAARKFFGWIMFHSIWFKRHMFWYYVAYVCTVYFDVFKLHWQTIYCEKFTVEETRNFTWPMFGEDDRSIRSTIMLKKHAESCET